MISVRAAGVCIAFVAVLACGLKAQTAVAAWQTATNTTGVTCVKGGGSLDFSDAHCDSRVSAGTGEYGHLAIASGTSTSIEVSSSETSKLTGSLLGASVEITCHKASNDTAAASSIENTYSKTVGSDFHGTAAIVFEECTLTGNGSPNCEVGNGRTITFHMLVHAVEEPGTKGMGIELTPTEGTTTYVEIPFSGSGCLLSSAKVKGTMRATGASSEGGGTTIELKPADEGLTFGGSPATLEGKFSVRTPGGTGVGTTTASGPQIGITAFTCVKGAGNKDFGDPHCDDAVTAGTGEYGHEPVAQNAPTELEVTNENTESDTTDSADAIFEANVVGLEARITATKVRGSGHLEDVQPKEGSHKTKGEVTIEYTKLHVDKPVGCLVTEPLKVTSNFESIEEGSSMGVQFTPKEGSTFVDLTFEGEECALAGITAHVSGTATATGGAGGTAKGSGATAVFEPAHESLAVGKASASMTSTVTVKMKEGNPIALTTIE